MLRRAIAQLVLAVEPEYLLVEGQVKEFFVAFFNLGTQVKYVRTHSASAHAGRRGTRAVCLTEAVCTH